ncbi:MAG: gluconate 2-dehydrogenase subunit 3 family protein [Alphaproteobacteria bacterium]
MKANQLKRREFLQLAAWAAAGTLAAGQVMAMSHEQHAFVEANPGFMDGTPDYFDAEARAVVSRVADMIIPKTDTPGAIDANAPAFLEMMVEHWMNDEERSIFMAGVEGLQSQDFMALSADKQAETLAALETEASGHQWYALGRIMGRGFDSTMPFICQMKELTACGFFLSEVGSTEALEYNHVAGYLEGDIPLEDGQASWASELLSV